MIESGIAEDGPERSRVASIGAARKRIETPLVSPSSAERIDARLEARNERRLDATSQAPTETSAETPTPSSTTRARARTLAPAAIPLPPAMSYCARHLLDALNGGGDANGRAALNGLSASTRELLLWWFGDAACRARRRNFHAGQREAIAHTILAHELFRSDDPQRLFRDACGAWRSASASQLVRSQLSSSQPSSSMFASYRLRMAPGSGVRWVAQALWLWQWAGEAEQRAFARQDARQDACFDARATILAGDRAGAQRFADALFGPTDEHGVRDPANGRFARGFDVFVPPRLRAPLLRWLSACAADPDGSPLRIATLDERDVALRHRTIAPLRMVVGDGAHQLAWNDKRPAPLATSETETSSHPPYRDIAGGAARNAARERPARMLWLEFDDGIDDPPADAAVLTDLPLARAMRIGATKSVLLTETGDRSVEKPRTVDARYRRGRRPVLPCRHRPPLDAGLRLLERYDRETASLRSIDADDAPPALLVVCEDPYWRRAVVAYAHAHGVGNALICDEGNVAQQVRARVLIDTLPPQHAAMQGRFCAVVVLREGGSHDVEDIDAGRLLAPALAPRWRDAAFAELKAEDRERIADGRSPCGLIDMLPAIASHWAAHWPANGARGAQQHPGLPYARARDLPTSTGDMCVVGLREAYRDFDFALPDPATAHLRASSMLSAQPHRRMRASCSMPVRKCVYTHQGWTKRSDGMERGLIEMAEDDPHVAAFCLFDATRHPWPVAAERPLVADAPTDATLADAPPACPHALIRTTGYVYVVQFAPALPLRTAADIEPPGVGAARDAMAAWCRRVNALPGDRRQYREWRPVQVQAPLFWSWKRRGGSLSSLLSALAETTPITTQRPRLAQPLDGAL